MENLKTIFKRDKLIWKLAFMLMFVFISLSFVPLGENQENYFQDVDVNIMSKIIILILYIGAIFFLFTKTELHAEKLKEGFFEIHYKNVTAITIGGLAVWKGVILILKNGSSYIVFYNLMKNPEEFMYSLYSIVKKNAGHIIMSDDFISRVRSFALLNNLEFKE